MQTGCAGGTAGSFEGVVGGDGIDVTDSADAAVTGEDLVAQIAGVSAETPLVDAVVAAEGAAASGEDFEVAPAAERKVVGPARKGVACGAASGQGAGGEIWVVGRHGSRLLSFDLVVSFLVLTIRSGQVGREVMRWVPGRFFRGGIAWSHSGFFSCGEAGKASSEESRCLVCR